MFITKCKSFEGPLLSALCLNDRRKNTQKTKTVSLIHDFRLPCDNSVTENRQIIIIVNIPTNWHSKLA